MSAVIETGDAPLELEQLTQLRSAAAGKTRAERGRLIPGVGRDGMAQALAGLPVRASSRELIRIGLERLERLAAEATPSVLSGPLVPASGPNDYEGLGRERFWDMTPEQRTANLKEIVKSTGAWVPEPDKRFAVGWLAEKSRFERFAKETAKAPVCPRCLGVTPGTPNGGPETPHPGPFTEELCEACSRAAEWDLRKEGRIQAADFEARRRAASGDETRAKTVRERPARERLVTAMMSADGRPREEAERLADRWIDGQAIHGSWLPEFAEPVRLAREEVKPCCDGGLGPGAGYCREHNPGSWPPTTRPF